MNRREKPLKKGLTLIEVLVVVAIMGVVLSIVVASFSALNSFYLLEGETQTIVTILKEARSQTLSGKAGYQYGVHIGSTSVALFRGSSYQSGASSNEVFTLHPKVAIGTTSLSGGGFDVIFVKIKGSTGQFGTTTVYLVDDPVRFKQIVIKESGIIDIK